jgi:hypothetical protein
LIRGYWLGSYFAMHKGAPQGIVSHQILRPRT